MDSRRSLPSVDAVLRHPVLRSLLKTYTRAAVTGLVRERLEEARRKALDPAPSLDDLSRGVIEDAQERWRVGPEPVINATGVVLHTNLGRAPLSRAAAEAAMAVATGYSTLEFDLARGARGSRYGHLAGLLREVTGAEDGIAVNNNAAALVLVLVAFCRRRDVIVSRGQAVEIGGGFRIPAIMRESGARLIEVGTTNKTRPADYDDAITPRTAAILRVHASNFKIIGFTEEVELGSLTTLAHRSDILLIDDVGSGSLLDARAYGLGPEPLVQESIAGGADLVLFSGDKLLGGPQAGLVVGRANLIARLRAHPLMRVLRPDKVTIAALGATLAHYVRGEAETEIPVWRMISTPLPVLRARAQSWLAALPAAEGVTAAVESAASTVGGGSLPGETLPTCVLSLRATHRGASWASAAAASLRTGSPHVVARVGSDRVLMDPRTVLPEQDDALVRRVADVIGAGGLP